MMQTKDFKGQDLRGKSFKNQDLTGADFSDCDLRGVDFSFANLTDAKFCDVRMGRAKKACFPLLCYAILILFLMKTYIDYKIEGLISELTNRVIIFPGFASLSEVLKIMLLPFISICLLWESWLNNSMLFSRYGTKFAFATLQGVDFSHADLKYACFKNAKISNCNFRNAKNHHLALFENTPLEPRKVRDLVIDGIITDKNFSTLDLRGLDFSNLNLEGFDFSHANLSGANLSHTQLTGATLEGWAIDTETRLDDIDCRYYYYLENGAKKRMPPKGEEYSAGEFTRIFQKIANTIDFIAHNEMELAAIKLSVEQVRVENGNDDIRVQAIEEKDGFIVVKVTVPKTEDRGVLYHEVNVLKQDYEAKIQGLMAEKHIQIGKIEVLKEQLKEQRQDFLDKIEGKITVNTTIIDSTIHGSVATAETIDNSRHQSFDGTASNANINFGDNATLTNTVQPLDNQDENHTSH